MAKNSLRTLKDQFSGILSELGTLKDMSLPENWEENSLFTGCKDSALRIVTQELFPKIGKWGTLASPKNTHPVFLLKRNSNFAYNFCPMSSKTYNSTTSRCVPKGTRLLHSVRATVTDKDSYILEEYSFKLVENNLVVGPKNFFGTVHKDDIQGVVNNMGGGPDE